MSSFATCRRGAAAVEAALVLPILVFAGMGAADAGYLFSEEHRMKSGLAAGARYLSKARDPATAQASAVNIAVTGRRDGSGYARVSGWKASDVSVTYRLISNTTGAYTGGGNVAILRIDSPRARRGGGRPEAWGGGPGARRPAGRLRRPSPTPSFR